MGELLRPPPRHIESLIFCREHSSRNARRRSASDVLRQGKGIGLSAVEAGKDADYAAFERILAEARRRTPADLLAYCLMPNHWHLLLRPAGDRDLSRFVGWLTLTHTQRWHAHHHTAGSGHLYQGRFKSFPIQGDDHFLTACRYVERNALRAGLVPRAADWPWGSLARRERGDPEAESLLSPWPIERPPDRPHRVEAPLTPAEGEALRLSLARGRPFGRPEWQCQTAARLGLGSILRPRGRPRKALQADNLMPAQEVDPPLLLLSPAHTRRASAW